MNYTWTVKGETRTGTLEEMTKQRLRHGRVGCQLPPGFGFEVEEVEPNVFVGTITITMSKTDRQLQADCHRIIAHHRDRYGKDPSRSFMLNNLRRHPHASERIEGMGTHRWSMPSHKPSLDKCLSNVGVTVYRDGRATRYGCPTDYQWLAKFNG